jgi:hypothetical protein
MTALVQARQLCRLRNLASDRALRALGVARTATDAATAALASAEATAAAAAATVVATRHRLADDPANATARLACHAAAERRATDAADDCAAARDDLGMARRDEALARAALLRARLRADAMTARTTGIARGIIRAAEERIARETDDSRRPR